MSSYAAPSCKPAILGRAAFVSVQGFVAFLVWAGLELAVVKGRLGIFCPKELTVKLTAKTIANRTHEVLIIYSSRKLRAKSQYRFNSGERAVAGNRFPN